MSDIRNKCEKYLKPFLTNKNTGNCYEIWVALKLFRQMGMTDEDFESLRPTLKEIEALGKGNKDVSKFVDEIKKAPIGDVIKYQGRTIYDIQNLTQDDSTGTGDIALIGNDGSILYTISVAEGTYNKSKPHAKVKKVVTNAGCKRLGCSEKFIAQIKQKEFEIQKKMHELYGEMQHWPTRKKMDIRITPCKEIAGQYCETFTQFDAETKRKVWNDVLHINTKQADILCLVDKKKLSMVFFAIGKCPIQTNDWTPIVKADSVFVNVYHNDTLIAKTQVKENNGAGTSMRKWNVQVQDFHYLYNSNVIDLI